MMKYFTVGPSQLYPIIPNRIKKALDEDVLSLSHRSKYFEKLFQETTRHLRSLLNIPKSHSIFFLSSGTEGMERVIQNMVAQNSLHFVNGAFSERFYQTAKELGKNPKKIEVPYGSSFDWKNISIAKTVELACFTHNETSTGVAIEMKEVYKIKKKNPKILTAIDIVSSVPYVDIKFSMIDAVFFSVQKGFGLPSGLGVLIVSPAAIDKSLSLEKQNVSTGSYHSFSSLKECADKFETPETPNILDIYLLNEVIQDMLKKGINVLRRETELKATLIETCVENNAKLEYLAKNKKHRSRTTHVILVQGGSESCIRTLQKNKYLVNRGYGSMKSDCIRIANFPAHTIEDMKKLVNNLVTIW